MADADGFDEPILDGHGFEGLGDVLDLTVNDAWAEFARRLADYIAAMSEQDLLVLEPGFDDLDESEGSLPCVQFLVWDTDLVRCEVPSNPFLHPQRSLSDEDQTHLVDLGWSPPTRSAEDESDNGSPAFFVDKRQSWADQLAAMTVAVMRDIWGLAHPSFLRSDVSGNEGALPFHPGVPAPPLVPRLDAAAAVTPTDADHLRELIARSLIAMLGVPPERDPDGDIPVRVGDAIMFVGPLGDTLDVQLFAPLVRDISDRTRAAELTADLNRKWSRIKFVLIDDRMSAFLEVPGNPFVPQHLMDTCKVFSDFLRTVDDEFATRFGGDLFFIRDSPSTADATADAAEVEVPPELLTLLHLDSDGTETIDAETVVDVCGRDRDQVPPAEKTTEPKDRPEQMGLFSDPGEQTLFDDPTPS